ncbi:hypothetical protein [Marinobacter arenosus]|uniref:hypothetical protein n=1 Tax=Marinobacter arenosus TaxID=2856822 RepID=UPI001C4D222E|nr:hypothetical protein [Marinobacter arenosus]MBW0149563.1 hypothetical protein [Marinobacter arenosus]
MRLPLTCMKCAVGANASSHPPYPKYVELRDDGRYEFTCEKGHTTVTVLQEQKFEVLFDLGAYAILDGYYREAVASFTSSLERFYEFFIKASLFEDGLEESAFAETWKEVSSQSERQLGAFIFLYLKCFSERPALLRPKQIKFRNEVIHKGKIPSRSEAIDYGQAVLETIRPIMQRTKTALPIGVQQTVLNHLKNSRKQDESQSVTTMTIATTISLNDGSGNEPSLEEALSEKEWWRARW